MNLHGKVRSATLFGLMLASGRAAGTPQASVGLTVGGAFEDVGRSWRQSEAHLGGRADVLFLRSRGTDMAVGPYVDVATSWFRDFDGGGGLEWLLPVRDDLPLVLSAGAFVRDGEGRAWAPGLDGGVFFGSRSFNFHSWYGLAAGLFAQTRWVPAAPGTVDVIFGLQIDAELLLMPSMLLWGLLVPRDR